VKLGRTPDVQDGRTKEGPDVVLRCRDEEDCPDSAFVFEQVRDVGNNDVDAQRSSSEHHARVDPMIAPFDGTPSLHADSPSPQEQRFECLVGHLIDYTRKKFGHRQLLGPSISANPTRRGG